jgi:hypothetical protein
MKHLLFFILLNHAHFMLVLEAGKWQTGPLYLSKLIRCTLKINASGEKI